MGRSSVFLSGWEYNRLLQKDVLAPMQSALPGRVLREGAMPFWLFEKVFCTKESLDNEILAYDKLGWATGGIFADLADWGWLVPVDWQDWAKSHPSAAKRLQVEHECLVNEHGYRVRKWLGEGQWEELDKIKARLLSPILDQLDCFLMGPNSLENWFPGGDAWPRSAARAIGATIAEPLSAPNTLTLCEAPGKGLPHHVLATQRAVEEEYEKPMIPRLLAGNLTKEEYYTNLSSHSGAYQAINRKMEAEWKANKEHLKDLRHHAEQTIWKELHDDWLPRAESDPSFIPDLRTLVGEAITRARFPFIDKAVDWGILVLSSTVAGALIHAGAEPWIVGPTTYGGRKLGDEIGERRKESDKLRLFYQRVLRSRSPGD